MSSSLTSLIAFITFIWTVVIEDFRGRGDNSLVFKHEIGLTLGSLRRLIYLRVMWKFGLNV